MQNLRWPAADFQINVSVLDSLYQDIMRDTFQTELRADSSAIYLGPHPLIGTYTTRLPRGQHLAAISLESQSNQARGHATSTFEIRNLRQGLAVSDIELRFGREGPPNPSHVFLERSRVYVALDIYNLARNHDGLYEATVTHGLRLRSKRLSVAQRVIRALRGRSSRKATVTAFSGTYTTVARNPRTSIVLGIDLSELSSGEYIVEISVCDLTSGRTAKTSTNLTIASEMVR